MEDLSEPFDEKFTERTIIRKVGYEDPDCESTASHWSIAANQNARKKRQTLAKWTRKRRAWQKTSFKIHRESDKVDAITERSKHDRRSLDGGRNELDEALECK